MNAHTGRHIANFAIFQGAWFLCVLRPDAISAWITLGLVGAHLLIFSQAPEREARFLVMAAVLGICIDTLWQNLGVLQFPAHEGPYASGMIPGWLMAIWLIFATTLHHSLRWIGDHRWLPVILAPIGGPFAYWSASRLGAIEIGHGALGLVLLAIGWLLIFPTQLGLMKWMENREKQAPA